MTVTLPPNYKPSEKEEYLNDLQLEYFRQKLLRWRVDLLGEAKMTRKNLRGDTKINPDLADRASLETDRSVELRTRDRARKLISKIDQAVHVSSHLDARIPQASHHEVRPPGGSAARHSSALSFWLVDQYHFGF